MQQAVRVIPWFSIGVLVVVEIIALGLLFLLVLFSASFRLRQAFGGQAARLR